MERRLKDLVNQEGNENWANIRDEMGLSMEEGCGIYRKPELMKNTIDKLAELHERFKRVRITDNSSVFNTDLLYTIELGHGLNLSLIHISRALPVSSPGLSAINVSVWSA